MQVLVVLGRVQRLVLGHGEVAKPAVCVAEVGRDSLEQLMLNARGVSQS